MKSPNWLSLETSSSKISMAIGHDEECLCEISKEGNASILIEPMFQELKPPFETIKHCYIGRGPGSYNGLRVGYAFLKGLLCTAPLPVIQVPTPLTLAMQAGNKLKIENTEILVINNARQNELYAALVKINKGLPKMEWESIADATLLASKLPANLKTIVSHDFIDPSTRPPAFQSYEWFSIHPSAFAAARCGYRLNLPQDTLNKLEPHYVRAAVQPKAIAK